MANPKKRLFRVEIERVQITIHSVLIDAKNPAQAVKDVVGDKNSIQRHFTPIYTDDQTKFKSIREIKRGK